MEPKRKWWVAWRGGVNYKVKDVTDFNPGSNLVTFENYWEAWALCCKCQGKEWDKSHHLRFHK